MEIIVSCPNGVCYQEEIKYIPRPKAPFATHVGNIIIIT